MLLVVMKSRLGLKIFALIGVIALGSAGYSFWLMTVPLSYNWVPVVLVGFVVALGVFVISLITSFIAFTIAPIPGCFADPEFPIEIESTAVLD